MLHVPGDRICIDDARLARAINGQWLSAMGRWMQGEGGVRRECGPARMMETWRKWDGRDRRRGKKSRKINKGGSRNCELSLRGMNRVLIDPETEAIIPVQWAQQLQGKREGRRKTDGEIEREDWGQRGAQGHSEGNGEKIVYLVCF